jgi:hypothetical protein
MSQETPPQLKQNELFIEYGHVQRLVEMKIDAKNDSFKLTFENDRLSTESTGQIFIKCRLPGKDSDLTFEYGRIDELTLRRLIDLSIQQQLMKISTDHHKGIPAWLETSLQRISDLRLGRDMLDLLASQGQALEVPQERKFDLRLYINEALQKEVNELTQHLHVGADGIRQIRALLDIAGSEGNAPMIRYGLNAVNGWNAPHLQDALRWIAAQLNLPDDVRRSAASFL